MSGSEAAVPTKRNWWVIGAFVALASVLIGMKCLCPDPAAAFRAQVTGTADVRGAPLRAAVAPVPPTPAVATAKAPEAQAAAAPSVSAVAETPPPPAAAVEPPTRTPVDPPPVAPAAPPAPAAPVVAAKPAEQPKPAEKPVVAASSKVVKITWDDISKYTYVPPDPDADPTAMATAPSKEKANTDQIPADVRAMSGKRYSIEGYAVPLDYEKGIVTKLILLPAPLACCFAEAPPMNRWIMVSNDSKSEFDYGKYNMLRATGVFDVGEEMREGYVVGIYRMKAEKVEIVKDE